MVFYGQIKLDDANDNYQFNYSKTIPKVIHCCMNKIENISNEFIDNLKNLNPKYKIKLYDNKKCEKYIKNNFEPLFYKLFNKIEWGPIKSDLFRTCIIYKEGGIYTDIDNYFYNSFDSIINNNTDMLLATSYIPGSLNPALLISKPKNPLLKQCLEVYKWIFFNYKNNYWYSSIVKIMSFIFKKEKINFSNYSNSSFYKSKYKILNLQLLNESWGEKKYKNYLLYNLQRIKYCTACVIKGRQYRKQTNILKNNKIIAILHSPYHNDKLTKKI